MPKSEYYTVEELTKDPRTGRNGERPSKDYTRFCSCGVPIHNSNQKGLCGDCFIKEEGKN